jgi:glycosyltransferase involved in cell wall biosynthesis
MRVIHVSAYFAPAYGFGGPPRSLLALCRAQQTAGLSIDVFTTTANNGPPLPVHPAGVDVEGVRVRYFSLSAPRRLLGASGMTAPLAAAVRGAALVHVHGLFNRTVWTAAAAARSAGVPYVLSPRGMLETAALSHHAWRKRASWRLFDRRAFEGAACWHATSSLEAETLRRRDGSARRIAEIPNAVDPVVADEAARAEARRFAGVPAAAPYVLFLGRVHPIKRLDLLAAAFARMGTRAGGVHLVIAGPDERGHRAALAPLFEPLAARVHWCGAVDGPRKAGLLSGAAALVLCSDSESFGMSVAESLAAGVPVVVSRTCPWPSIETLRCGYWVEQSADGLAGGLTRLLDDPGESRAMGDRGRELVAREFGAAAIASRWIALYREVAGAARVNLPTTA